MLISWLDFGEILLETFLGRIFFKKFWYVFSSSNTLLAISQEGLVRLMWNVKEVQWVDVPDSDRGDFRRQRAVDLSSYVV